MISLKLKTLLDRNKILTGVPPGLSLGRLVFNIIMNNWR